MSAESVGVKQEWHVVEAVDGQDWPCTVVDQHGRSLLGVHNGTPIVRDRDLANRIVLALNESPAEDVR